MITYISAFIFYTLAMVGILLVGFIIYKKTFLLSNNDNKGIIKIVDSISIGPKKNLLIIKIKNERFLIASGAEHTTFLSKLKDDNNQSKKEQKEEYINPKVQKQMDFQQENLKQARLNNIQKQFRQLYSPENYQEAKPIEQTMDRKEMIRKLLKDLNDSNYSNETKTGSY
mgnify:CR=1 FL=1